MPSGCMPGMTMPGCPVATSGGPDVQGALLVVLVLAAYVLVAFGYRTLRRSQINGYSWVSDWLGHGLHAPGMILMALLTGGWVHSIGPLFLYELLYGALGVLFLVRTIVLREHRRASAWHVVIHLSMVYMFSMATFPAVTAVFLGLYAVFLLDYAWQTIRRLESGVTVRGNHRSLYLLGTTGHVAIALSMGLMLAVMQWPAALA